MKIVLRELLLADGWFVRSWGSERVIPTLGPLWGCTSWAESWFCTMQNSTVTFWWFFIVKIS